MSNVEIIFKYFPQLSDLQKEQFTALKALYEDWNTKINVISRKDIGELYERHVLHSLGIAKVLSFRPGTSILDLGTGGGFPGIPLAILYPETKFSLIDSIGKKIKVAQAVCEAIGLKNVTTARKNAVEEKGKYDFIVTRGVSKLAEIVKLITKNIGKAQRNSLPNGLLCLKGGSLTAELLPYKKIAETWDLKDFFEEEFFETKKVLYLNIH